MAQTLVSGRAEELRETCRELLGDRRLVLVSNRGPVSYWQGEDGRWEAQRGTGGVVTALMGVTRFARTTWISGPATQGDLEIARSAHAQAVHPDRQDSSRADRK